MRPQRKLSRAKKSKRILRRLRRLYRKLGVNEIVVDPYVGDEQGKTTITIWSMPDLKS